MKANSFARGLFFLTGSALLLLQNQVIATPESVWDGMPGVVKSCDDFVGVEGDMAASGTVTFLRPMRCKAPLIFNIFNDTVIRSPGAINTHNVHFTVHPDANLAFSARVVVMTRDKTSSLPVIHTSGEVLFNVTGWTSAYTKGGLEDKGAMVKVLTDGHVESTYPVHFTSNALLVANKQARGENTHTIKLSPHYQNMLNDHHAGTDISKKREGTAEGVGIAAARRVSIDNADFPELTAEYRVSSRVNQVFSEVMAKRRAKNKKNRKPTTTTTTTDDDDDKLDVAPTSTPPFPHPASSEHSEVSPKSAWVKKPTYKLQVGEQLKGTLRSADGRSALWPGVDGSLRFGVFLTPDGGKSGKGGVGFGVMEETSLLPSESDKALEALLLRRELQLEGEGGRGGERENEEGRVVGNWWSLRQASKQRQREIAAENEGEVCVSVSDKGCVKVTVDGTTVLSKSGKMAWDWMNRLPWTRPRDDGYEVHVTDVGIEVRLGERKIWGVTANDLQD